MTKSLQKSEIGKIGCKNLQISQQIERGNFVFFGKRDFCRNFELDSAHLICPAQHGIDRIARAGGIHDGEARCRGDIRTAGLNKTRRIE